MKRLIQNLFVLMLPGIMLTGCYPGGVEYASDTDVVLTRFDEDWDFSGTKTYYMPDTVSFQTNIADPEWTEGDEEALLNVVEEEFEAIGYTRVSDTTNSSAPRYFVGIEVLAVANSGADWVPASRWWGWYPINWGWGPGGWYYPSGYWVPYSYTQGTVTVFMAVPDEGDLNGDGSDDSRIVWNGIFNGLVSSKPSINQQRIERAIRKAFDISPYL